jgi:archaellin
MIRISGSTKLSVFIILILIFQNSFFLTAADPQPSYDNNVLYLHYDENLEGDDRFWMNAESTTVTNSYNMHVVGSGDFTFDFPLNPKLNQTLFPDIDKDVNVLITIHLEAATLNPQPLRNVWIEWTVGDSMTHSDAPDNVEPGYITFHLRTGRNKIFNETEINLRVHFEVGAQTTIDLYTDGTSTIVLDLLEDSDNDGDPDPTDPDDDNDGFTDEEEIEKGTDPKDPDSKPTKVEEPMYSWENWEPCLSILVLIIVIIIFIIFWYYTKKR